MHRSELTVDLGALRRNVRTLLRALGGAQLWAVVKADAYGHGAVDAAGAALGAGAHALCVATLPEALELRLEFPTARILCMGPVSASRELAEARDAHIELAVSGDEIPQGIRVHLKVDTGMGRFGLTEVLQPTRDVVGLMSHLATADSNAAFAHQQIQRFAELARPFRDTLICHLANSAAALRIPDAHFDAARCGVALYGLSPFQDDPSVDGLEPVLRWDSHLAQVKQLQPGESTGYGHASSRSRRPGSASCRSATGTASAATSPGPTCESAASCARSSGRSRWTRSPSSSTASCPSGLRSRCSATACSRRRTRRSRARSTTSS